ncbi:hypothetical protein ACFQFC_13265 [Amorphoplanes digitatis]|uniref:Uncharacterized protein n=1 Tax=Actinoplanes digitatis TaxID=1868 RepID=A0A7W7MSB9_9ACTN|nr:hypothetical protein [Actinoplanes digitatis]MBB4765171.1 hypothetical protein [Actinoplanes digitatis]GID94622.1 hypothetical protein Adi01nite_40340 [Actinoplanes digitatis]
MPPERPREVGSEFHWDPAALLGADQGGGLPRWLPSRHALFATGCGALIAALHQLPPGGRLHMPSYFCMGVAEALSAEAPIGWYRHLPDERGPSFETLLAEPGDVVLAQNLFGRDVRDPWDAWRDRHPGVDVVEDHSHDPFSAWARESTAAYAVASLRKTLPLPDGGLLWSPAGLDLPRPRGEESPGAQLKLAAMLLKSAWLDGRPIGKDGFRALQQQGEYALLGSAGPANAVTVATLPLLDVAGLRATSTGNVRALLDVLPERCPAWSVLTGGPADAAPFRVQLLCPSEETRDALRDHLAGHGIFAPVHWHQDRAGLWSGDEEAADLAQRMLTVPVDHRCDSDDIRRIADVLAAFAPASAPAR